jgi:hypothetical protein
LTVILYNTGLCPVTQLHELKKTEVDRTLQTNGENIC